MSAFYTTITIAEPHGIAIAPLLREARAYITPPDHGYRVIYPDPLSAINAHRLVQLCKRLSVHAEGPALLTSVQDDQVLYYWLCTQGSLVDSYVSHPGLYQDEPGMQLPEGGDPLELIRLFGRGDADQISIILFHPHGFDGCYRSEAERHRDLVAELGLPLYSAGFGFESIESGELPDGLAQAQIALSSQPG